MEKIKNSNTETKKPISQFEFAIMEIADPERSEQYRPYTDQERHEIRLTSLIEQASIIKINPKSEE